MDETTSITIYRKAYTLPKLNEPDFLNLQDRIRERQQLIQTGKRTQKRWFGLFPKEEQLGFDEKFTELERLVQDYHSLIGFLKQHKEAYQRFFLDLSEEVKAAVSHKCQKLSEGERERQALEQTIQSEDLKMTLRLQKQQILRIALLLGKSSLLMLKKITLISQGINKLVEDQDMQKQVLQQMVGQLDEHKRVYKLKKELDNLERAVMEMATVAVNLEQYLKPILGTFQGLIEEVVQIDGQLSRTVQEVESLVQDILRSESRRMTFNPRDGLSEHLLNFLVTSEEKRARLSQVLEQVEESGWRLEGIDFPDEDVDLEATIQSINAHVKGQLTELEPEFPVIEVVPVQDNSLRTLESFRENLSKTVVLEMIAVSGGTFLMGAAQGEEGASDDEYPQHTVTVPSFFIGKYPITQEQWRAVAKLPKIKHDLKPDPSHFKGDKLPVECVSWYDAVEFCARLSRHTQKNYRLPSEAEWEYACRAGTTTPFHFGDTISTEVANYKGQYQQTTPVGQFPSNAFGLYDMHGNVWEWCQDDWHNSYKDAPVDSSAWIDDNDNHSQRKILRGGSWYFNPRYCRSALRLRNYLVNDYSTLGLRVVCAVAELLTL